MWNFTENEKGVEGSEQKGGVLKTKGDQLQVNVDEFVVFRCILCFCLPVTLSMLADHPHKRLTRLWLTLNIIIMPGNTS